MPAQLDAILRDTLEAAKQPTGFGGGLPAATTTTAGLMSLGQVNAAAAATTGTALADVVNTTELFQTVFIDTYNGVNSNPQNGIATLFTAPYAMRITRLVVSFERFNWTTDTTNYMTFTMRKYTAAGSGLVMTAKTTKDEAITARRAWAFDAVAWTAANQTLAAGDAVNFGWGKTGTVNYLLPLTVTVGYEPL